MDDALWSLQDDLTRVFDDGRLLYASKSSQNKACQNGTALTLF